MAREYMFHYLYFHCCNNLFHSVELLKICREFCFHETLNLELITIEITSSCINKTILNYAIYCFLQMEGIRNSPSPAKSPTKGPSKSSSKEPKEVAVPAENPFDRSVSCVCVCGGGGGGDGRGDYRRGSQITYQGFK